MAEQVLNITREAMRNAARHSGASRILVRMGQSDAGGFVSVEDDGQGFDVNRYVSEGASPDRLADAYLAFRGRMPTVEPLLRQRGFAS